MKPYKPDWYQGLADSPIPKTFSVEQMNRIEERICGGRKLRGSKGKWWIGSIVAAAVCLGILFVVQPSIVDTAVKKVSTWLSHPEVAPPPMAPPRGYEEPNVELNKVMVQLSTPAYNQPDLYVQGVNPPEFIADIGIEYTALAEQGQYTQITNGDQSGWILSWYIAEDEDDRRFQQLEPFEMIVDLPTIIHAFPSEQAPQILDLGKGRVVRIMGQLSDWYVVAIMFYAEPISPVELWVPKDSLVPYEDSLAKEGYLKVDWDGTDLYQRGSKDVVVESIESRTPAIILEEQDDMYRITAPGGMSGWVYKEDFIPNPFAGNWNSYVGMAPEVRKQFDQFIESRDEEALRGLEPLDIYRMYLNARIMDDAGLVYDLLIHGEEYDMQTRDEFIAEHEYGAMEQSDEQINKLYLDAGDEQLEIKYANEDEAYIQPVDAGPEDWFFRILRNKSGIWKVSWLARQ